MKRAMEVRGSSAEAWLNEIRPHVADCTRASCLCPQAQVQVHEGPAPVGQRGTASSRLWTRIRSWWSQLSNLETGSRQTAKPKECFSTRGVPSDCWFPLGFLLSHPKRDFQKHQETCRHPGAPRLFRHRCRPGGLLSRRAAPVVVRNERFYTNNCPSPCSRPSKLTGVIIILVGNLTLRLWFSCSSAGTNKRK